MTILSTTRSQYNINRAMAARFWPDCYFSRSVGRRPIFLTLNKVVNLPSGHLTIVAGRLFGHRPISSSNDQIFGRCPNCGDRRDSRRSPLGVLSSAANIFQPISGQHCLLRQPSSRYAQHNQSL